ncbi:pilus assembly FimT family protein [Acinetobacter terrestris]|uniref:pilus assembly FimT family protein n=1 Tax=Acinetobacter terrestris TaxID=2529843 RepID=UPI00103B021E|nr:prepilin-type N-terminal cleavage/methylation domain-containing protein [Acinetobacter terrestris]TCB62794.1 prepilin-type N-terminal cleavage/methylation domain-containing protein [Acinetobacter terrestris]
MVRQRGVTLIELMIGIALLAILAVAIFPLGRAWVANQQITKTEKLFLEAYARAKNEALRNPNSIRYDPNDLDSSTVAIVIVDNAAKKIKVQNSAEEMIWEASIAPTVTVTLSTGCASGHQQIELNNNAYFLATSCTFYKVEANGGAYASDSL